MLGRMSEWCGKGKESWRTLILCRLDGEGCQWDEIIGLIPVRK